MDIRGTVVYSRIPRTIMIPRAGQFVKSKAKKGAREDWHPFSENFLPVRGEDVALTTELCTTAPGQKPGKMNIGFG